MTRRRPPRAGRLDRRRTQTVLPAGDDEKGEHKDTEQRRWDCRVDGQEEGRLLPRVVDGREVARVRGVYGGHGRPRHSAKERAGPVGTTGEAEGEHERREHRDPGGEPPGRAARAHEADGKNVA